MLLIATTLMLVGSAAAAAAPPDHFEDKQPEPCRVGCAMMFVGPAVFDEGTTLYGQSRGKLREVGPLRDTRVRLLFKSGLAILWWKEQGKSKAIRFGVPVLFLLEGFHNVLEMKRGGGRR